MRRTAAGVLCDVVARHDGPAAGGLKQRGQHPDRGRLTGAIRPEEAVDLAFRHLEIDAVDGLDAALELARELMRLDRGHGESKITGGRDRAGGVVTEC